MYRGDTYMRSKTTAACTDVLLPRAITRLVPSVTPPHGHNIAAVVQSAAAAAHTTDLLSIAAAAFIFRFFLYSFYIILCSTTHSSPVRQQSSFTRAAYTYVHSRTCTDIIIYRHYCNNDYTY